MKRRDAITKLVKICQRLDSLYIDDCVVIPIRLYLFGSLLTNKPNPNDVDLIFQYKDRDWSPIEVYKYVLYGPLPIEKVIKYLRKGMRMIHFERMTENDSVEIWAQEHFLEHNMQFALIWEHDFDWIGVLKKIEIQAIEWDVVSEQWNKHVQNTAKTIIKEKGIDAAIDWMKMANRKRSQELY